MADGFSKPGERRRTDEHSPAPARARWRRQPATAHQLQQMRLTVRVDTAKEVLVQAHRVESLVDLRPVRNHVIALSSLVHPAGHAFQCVASACRRRRPREEGLQAAGRARRSSETRQNARGARTAPPSSCRRKPHRKSPRQPGRRDHKHFSGKNVMVPPGAPILRTMFAWLGVVLGSFEKSPERSPWLPA